MAPNSRGGAGGQNLGQIYKIQNIFQDKYSVGLYLDNHLSESIHTYNIQCRYHIRVRRKGPCMGVGVGWTQGSMHGVGVGRGQGLFFFVFFFFFFFFFF